MPSSSGEGLLRLARAETPFRLASKNVRRENHNEGVVEPTGFEPVTSSMPSRRAPNCATAPRYNRATVQWNQDALPTALRLHRQKESALLITSPDATRQTRRISTVPNSGYATETRPLAPLQTNGSISGTAGTFPPTTFLLCWQQNRVFRCLS